MRWNSGCAAMHSPHMRIFLPSNFAFALPGRSLHFSHSLAARALTARARSASTSPCRLWMHGSHRRVRSPSTVTLAIGGRSPHRSHSLSVVCAVMSSCRCSSCCSTSCSRSRTLFVSALAPSPRSAAASSSALRSAISFSRPSRRSSMVATAGGGPCDSSSNVGSRSYSMRTSRSTTAPTSLRPSYTTDTSFCGSLAYSFAVLSFSATAE
mmetsp:Transcript_42228/g.103933  ORF Transcript_42228/g.103933 Transcript_42228/m.103933 type:complete len:210 (-) Transcript_42228:125-754(-)